MINWYPGHMAKTKKQLQENIKLVDLVIELLDARIPISSQNPLIYELTKNKPKLVLLTKSSMADPKYNEEIEKYFKEKQSSKVLFIDSIQNLNINKISSYAQEILKETFEKEKAKGMKPRNAKAMIVGIPNVGKSTLINRLSQKKVTNVGNKPGVTKSLQWIRIAKDFDLLDTPGILWPKLEDQEAAIKLVLTGAIKDDIVRLEDSIFYFLDFLKQNYRGLLNKRYEIDEKSSNLEILEAIAHKRGFMSNQEYDYEKTYIAILTDFRNLRIGRISLDIDYE